MRLSYVSGEQVYKDTYGINNSRAFVSASHLFVARLLGQQSQRGLESSAYLLFYRIRLVVTAIRTLLVHL